MTNKILIPVAAAVVFVGVLLGGTLREPAAASVVPESERLAAKGVELQQRSRVTGNPELYPHAERALSAALELDGRNASALRGLAALAAARHRFSESLAYARRARALEPQVAAVHGLIGDASLELGRYREAFAAFDRLAALRPSAAAYARVSYARELTGDLDGALEAMELAIDSAGQGEPAAWARSLTGNLLLSLGRGGEAEVRFREALAFQPRYAQALAGLAEVALARGDDERAAALYRRAAKGSAVPEFHAALGDVLDRLGRRGLADRSWRRADELERLFTRHGGRNLLETAEFDLNHDRNIRSALDRARRGRAERPSVEGDHVLAWALYKNGLCAEARRVSLRSFRLGTLDVDGFYHHALIEECLGNDGEALRYRKRVEALAPDYLQTVPSARRLPPPR